MSGAMAHQENHDRNNKDDDEKTRVEADMILGSITSSMTLLAAVELNLLQTIADKEKETNRRVSSSELAAALKTDNPLAADMLERMLCLLATISVVSSSVEVGRGRVFGLTPVGRWFVMDENGMSFGPMVRLIHGTDFTKSRYKLKDAVLHGGVPFNKAHGMNAFEYQGIESNFNYMFNEAMLNYTTIVMTRILQSYSGFENIGKLTDVGGGLGHNLKMIISKYPTIKGTNFDLPHVIEHGISYPGMDHVAGDMFEEVPCADVIFMKWVLHDWGDEYCLKLLKNCHRSLPFNGKVIIVEAIMSDVLEFTTNARVECQKDVEMLFMNPGGKERTKKEFISLAGAAGFGDIRFQTCVCGCWVMEFYK